MTVVGPLSPVEVSVSRPLASPPIRALTLADELERLAPGWTWAELLGWPPDAFALTSAALADSGGAYRFVVCPPRGRVWPSVGGEGGWQERIRREGAAWAATAEVPGSEPPRRIRQLGEHLAAAEQTELSALEKEAGWELLMALLSLHAFADEASAGAGIRMATRLQRVAAARLAETGTLARLSHDRVRVLPKLRPPASGMTLRSLSHHLASDRSEVEARWYFPPDPAACVDLARRVSLLLVPVPERIRVGDFRPTAGPLLNMDPTHYGFYEYAPQEPFVLEELARLVEAAKRQVGAIDIVVLPEAAVEEAMLEPLQELIAAAGVSYLIAGAREPPGCDSPFGLSYAYLGGCDWQAPKQYKHHRWRMNAEQVHQYGLGAALDPSRDWWEAIGLRRRSITFVSLCECLTICPLVCEDLARPDPVSEVIRAVAPSLVVGLLLDGPQLSPRWPARYASVLADDPGCSVLTLTSLGMAERCQPTGFEPSRVISLWKDAHRGLQQIELAPDAHAVALTAHTRLTRSISADGREGKDVAELVLSGLEQIY